MNTLLQFRLPACVLTLGLLAAAGHARAQVPDLLKGEGPNPIEAHRKGLDVDLRYHGLRGWIHGHGTVAAKAARQILVTHVPGGSSLRRHVKVGDVLLGLDGKEFDQPPLDYLNRRRYGYTWKGDDFPFLMWRKGWKQPRTVLFDTRRDFTKGDTIDLTKLVTPHDWTLGATGARGWLHGIHGHGHLSTRRARQILITKVYRGSPADGVLREADVILGLEGTPFDYDARKVFGHALTRAETRAGGGRLQLLRWRGGKTAPVTIQLKIMGTYSKTTPWDCEKSENLIDHACAYLVRKGIPDGGEFGIPTLTGTLGLMATGEAKYMPFVKKHIDAIIKKVAVSGQKPPKPYYASWSWGYANLLLSEYYLLTKDATVLPAVRKYARALAWGQALSGTWGHGMAERDKKTGKPLPLGGYGTMNQAATVCWMSLVLAQRCGVDDPEVRQAITNYHHYLTHWVNTGPVSYGNNFAHNAIENHDDNGKTSAAAVGCAMFGDEEGTRFFSRMTVASYEQREPGHTGNFFSFLWGALGAARAGNPACAAFLRELTWFHDFERRWDGGFEYQGKPGTGNGIDPKTGRQRNFIEHQTPHWDTTGARLLMYCLPREKLVITGRNTYTSVLTPAEVADTIAAGRFPETPTKDMAGALYGECTEKQLFQLLASWSPVVRDRVARLLSHRKHVQTFRRMLRSSNKYARYGACTALRSLRSECGPAIDDLVACLQSKDLALQIHAIKALGASGDRRAATALLTMAARDLPHDRYDVLHRYMARAAFQDLATQTAQADRTLRMNALRRCLRSIAGVCRTTVARSAVPTLSLAEFSTLQSDLLYAFDTPATSYNTAIQLAVLQLMAKYHVEEGIDRTAWYVTNMKSHASEKRVPQVLKILLEYGAHAKRVVPKLEEAAQYFQKRENAVTGFPKVLSLGKAKAVRETVARLKTMDDKDKDKIKLISIAKDKE